MGQRRLPRRHVTFMYADWTASAAAIAIYGVATEIWHAMLAAFVGSGLSTAEDDRLDDTHADACSARAARACLLARLVRLDRPHPRFVRDHGPLAEAVGVRETLVAAGVLASLITFAFLWLPGMRETERGATYDRLRESGSPG
jgi:hypothetical protein